MEVVRHTESLLEQLAARAEHRRRLARAVGVDEPTAALLLEAAYAGGLIGEVDLSGTTTTRYGADQQVLPTAGYEVWRAGTLAQRWEQLARAWLTMTRQAGLVGQRDDRDRPITMLSAEAERAGAPAARRAVLEVLADLEPATGPTPEEVLALLDWRAPRRSRGRETAHREVLAEAATLGVTGLGALTSYGRLLLADVTAAGTGRAGRRPSSRRPGPGARWPG